MTVQTRFWSSLVNLAWGFVLMTKTISAQKKGYHGGHRWLEVRIGGGLD